MSALQAPAGVTIVTAEDADDHVIVTLTAPRLAEEETTDDGVETETEVVGEGGGDAEASGDDAGSGDNAGDSE